MSNLILDSLEIRNFRGLKELKIEKLGRVNLLVGKNNTGKTSVLEALRLYAQPASLRTLFEIFEERNEIDRASAQPISRFESPKPLPIEELFCGRQVNYANDETGSLIVIGPSSGPQLLISPKRTNPLRGSMRDSLILLFDFRDQSEFIDLLDYRLSEMEDAVSPFSETFATPCFFRNATRIDSARLSALWDTIALSDLETDVSAILGTLSSEIERLAFVPVGTRSPQRVPFVRLRGVDVPVPLRSLGDGVNRLLEIALTLVSAKDGFLLIDEFENGLHYSVQSVIWKFVFEIAKKLNVQVFATTHSFDCIQAFQDAASESDAEGVMIGLAIKKGKLLVGEYDEEDLRVVVEGQIEVRG